MLFARNAELGHEALDCGQDRVVAAARAPAHFLVGLEVLGLQAEPGASETAGSLMSQHSLQHLGEVGRSERHATDLRDADDVDEVLGTNAAAPAGPGSSRAMTTLS